MKLLESAPNPLLAPFVECCWYVETKKEETALRPDAILPNGTINLIFNLSGHSHREYDDERCGRFDELKTRWLSGIQDRAIVVGPTVCTRVIGVRFLPGGLVPFLRVAAKELVRLTVDPDLLWGKETFEVHGRLFAAGTAHDQLQLLQQWLLDQLNIDRPHEGIVRSLALLQRTSGNIPIEYLARTADFSLRQYRRRFEQAVGLSPKRLARILRFSKLIESIPPTAQAANWSGLAAACGYYDQSHLIADFREFANVSPTGYLARGPSIPGFLPLDESVSLFSNTGEAAPDTMTAE